jgi:hypothetical protein
MHPLEKRAAFLIWRDAGLKMNIEGLDKIQSFEGLEVYLDAYEIENMTYNKTNQQLGESTMKLLLTVIPSPLHQFARNAVYALSPPTMRSAMGFPESVPGLFWVLHVLFLFSGLFQRYFMLPRNLMLRRTPARGGGGAGGCPIFAGEEHHKMHPVYNPYENTYPNGYHIDELGPEKGPVKARELGSLYACGGGGGGSAASKKKGGVGGGGGGASKKK